MASFTIPRHGSRPSRISTNHPPNLELSGAINMTFYDGHAETVNFRFGDGDDWVRVGPLKIFVDGGILYGSAEKLSLDAGCRGLLSICKSL